MVQMKAGSSLGFVFRAAQVFEEALYFVGPVGLVSGDDASGEQGPVLIFDGILIKIHPRS